MEKEERFRECKESNNWIWKKNKCRSKKTGEVGNGGRKEF